MLAERQWSHVEKHHSLENPTHLYSSYLLSTKSLCKALTCKIGIVSISHKKKWSLWDFKTLAESYTVKKWQKQDFRQYSCFPTFWLFSRAPSSKFQFHACPVTAPDDGTLPDWHVNCKTCNKSADIWWVGEITGCTPMPHSLLLFVPLSAIIIRKPNTYSLFLQVSLQFLITHFWMGGC